MTSFAAKKSQRAKNQSKSFIIHSQPSEPAQSDSKIGGTDGPKSDDIGPKMYKELSDSLEIRGDDLKGRGVWSKRAFRRGEVLLFHRPHVSVLSTENLSLYCSHCTLFSDSKGENASSLKRCTKCKTIWYCSPKCQNADWAIHKLECAAITKWMASSPNGSPPGEAVRTLGRILWGRKVEGETSTWWNEMQSLLSHRASLPPSAIESHTQLAHALVRYLGVTSPSELSPYGLHSAGDLVDLISRFTTNTFTLTSPSLTPLGTCVSPMAALFNHSCLPNAVINFPRPPRPRHQSGSLSSPLLSEPEPILHVVALKDISFGEEILTSYIDTTVPTVQRQKALKETYNFVCACSLCSSSTIDPREVLWCPKSCGGVCSAPFPEAGSEESNEKPPRWQCTSCKTNYTPSAIYDIQEKRHIGLDALDKATRLQFSDPSRAFKLTSNITTLLTPHLPQSAHPLLSLLRLQQSLLIVSLPSSTPDPSRSEPLLDDTIRTTARAVSGLTAILPEGHPVRAIALTELGKLLAVDEPPPPSSSGLVPSSDNGTTSSLMKDALPSNTSTPFPPTGPARLSLAVNTLKQALTELMVGFGKSTGGGEVGHEVRQEIVRLEQEISVWKQGVKNVLEDTAPPLRAKTQNKK